jgi:hypothetical protein
MGNDRFEFVLYKNEPSKIICARNFSVDRFNPDVIDSLEIKTMMDNIVGTSNGSFGVCGIIPQSMKEKNVKGMWDYYKPYKTNNYKEESENEDTFYVEVRQKRTEPVQEGEQPYDLLIAKGSFSGNLFPRYLRSRVDIVSLVPEIQHEIKSTLSLKECTNLYGSVEL